MTAAHRARVAILGSCVSRDLLRIALDDETTCALYLARQSIISFGHPVTTNKPAEPEFAHNFQLACYRSDIEGSGLDRVLKTKAIEVLLLDIVDERHGVYVSPDNEVITRSIDGIKTGVYDTLDGWRHLAFGTDEHISAFTKQVGQTKEKLVQAGMFDKTVVVLAPWATRLTTGEKTPLSMGKTAKWANKVLPAYERAFETHGFTIIRPDRHTVIGDPDHQWGPAPFHYIPAFYESLAKQIRPYFTRAER